MDDATLSDFSDHEAYLLHLEANLLHARERLSHVITKSLKGSVPLDLQQALDEVERARKAFIDAGVIFSVIPEFAGIVVLA